MIRIGGVMDQHGEGVPQNNERATFWYRSVARHGSSEGTDYRAMQRRRKTGTSGPRQIQQTRLPSFGLLRGPEGAWPIAMNHAVLQN